MKKKIILIIPILIILSYVIFIFSTRDRMIGNMKINNIDCSFKNYDEIISLLEKNISQPKISIKNGDEELTSLNVSTYCKFSYDKDTIKAINDEIPIYERFVFFIFNYEKNISPTVSIDEKALNQVLIDSNGTTFPENAYIKYDKNEQKYIIVPETEGNVIDTEAASELIANAIANEQYSIDIRDTFIKAGILSDNTELLEELEKLNNSFNFSITYEIGTEKVPISKDIYLDWFEKDSNGIPLLDDDGNYAVNKEKVSLFVDSLAEKYDTVGKKFNFETSDEETVEIENGSYGYKLDKEKELSNLIENLKQGENISREPVWKQKELPSPNNTMDTYIEVSIENQHLWYYKDGELLLESDIVTGKKNSTDTDKGAWYVYSKQKDRYLTGPTWKTFVNYWMPFNGGEGLHDASWRNKFGGNIYKTNGSHGCVNLPSSFAKELYESIEVGTPVIVY